MKEIQQSWFTGTIQQVNQLDFFNWNPWYGHDNFLNFDALQVFRLLLYDGVLHDRDQKN